MSTADLRASHREDWVLANPWPYAIVGLISSLLALGTTHVLGHDWDVPRGFFFLLGLTSSSIALVVRLNSRRPAFLDELGPGARKWALNFLVFIFLAVGLGLSALLVMSLFRVSFVPWRVASLVVVWIGAAPVALIAAFNCWRARQPDTVIPWGHEAACLLILMGLSASAACWSLYFGTGDEWSTMRLFLSVVSFAAVMAAPFFLVGQAVRRVGLSLLFLLHFGGISTAALSQPPYPWVMGPIWTCIYRPYLEFMYLNNAYHFYAPEPGPSSHMWFRLIYQDEHGGTQGIWFKIPDMNEEGWHNNSVALEYQRYLSITENISQGTASTFVLFNNSQEVFNEDPDGLITWNMSPNLKRRWRKSEYAFVFKTMKEQREKAVQLGKDAIVGVPDEKKAAKPVPLDPKPLRMFNYLDHPDVIPLGQIAFQQQFMPANGPTQRLLASYVRHVAGRPHEVPASWTLKRIKVYKVRHEMLTTYQLKMRQDPRDPVTYQPFYMGEYDPAGVILDGAAAPDGGSPFLSWLMPVVRENYNDPNSLTLSFALRHAGDRNWATDVKDGKRRWFEPTRAQLGPVWLEKKKEE